MKKLLLILSISSFIISNVNAKEWYQDQTSKKFLDHMNYAGQDCSISAIQYAKKYIDFNINSKQDILNSLKKAGGKPIETTQNYEGNLGIWSGNIGMNFYKNQNDCYLAKTKDIHDFQVIKKLANDYPIFQNKRKECVNATEYFSYTYFNDNLTDTKKIINYLEGLHSTNSKVAAFFFEGQKLLIGFNNNREL